MATVFKRGGKQNRGGRYYIAYFDHSGKRQVRSARTTDKATAERIAAKLEAETALRRDGVIDVQAEAVQMQAKRTIAEHLADYEAKLVAAQRSDRHITTTVSYIRSIADELTLRTAAGITADGVVRYAKQLKDEGRSARTIQAYLTAIKGFTRWLTINEKLPRDPLASVQRPNPQSDRRRHRRMLLPEEWTWLRSVTLTENEQRFDMLASGRVVLYALAIQTGLRSSELRSLTRRSLFLDQRPPFVLCQAGSTKNRKAAWQYVQPELAEELRLHIATKTPEARVFRMPPRYDVAAMLRADLAAARKTWIEEARPVPEEHLQREQSDFLTAENHEGEILDFHSLRHTCGAWLSMTGSHPKAVQTVMRHSTITLTMDTYGHLFPGQEADAVARMPNMFSGAPPTGGEASCDRDSQAGQEKRSACAAVRARRGA